MWCHLSISLQRNFKNHSQVKGLLDTTFGFGTLRILIPDRIELTTPAGAECYHCTAAKSLGYNSLIPTASTSPKS